MTTIAIIGSNGLLGSDLVSYLQKKFKVTAINRQNYHKFIGQTFDILINANGNNKRYWANKNPREDFLASTVSVYNSIFDFPCNIYIYISSADIYKNHTGPKYTKETAKIDSLDLNPYGMHKHLSELIVKRYKKKYLILRLSSTLGKNLKKGPIYDVIQNNPIFITQQSRLQFITTSSIAEIIETLLKKSIINSTLNIGGKSYFPFTKIPKYFNKEAKMSSQSEKQVYEMNIEKLNKLYPSLKKSEEYLQDFLIEFNKDSKAK